MKEKLCAGISLLLICKRKRHVLKKLSLNNFHDANPDISVYEEEIFREIVKSGEENVR